jgi:hypothetical protein
MERWKIFAITSGTEQNAVASWSMNWLVLSYDVQVRSLLSKGRLG